MEYLTGVIPGYPEKQNGVGDNRACKLFVRLWNEKYPDFRCRVVYNSHDFGSYPDVQMSDDLFWGAFESELFPNGPETAADKLITEWNNNVANYSPSKWSELFGDINPVAFKMEQ